jgi:hypothetical protein
MLSTYVDTLAQSHDFVLAELKRMDEQNHQICCTVKPQRITEAASRRLSQRLVCEEENLRFSTFVSSFPYSQLEHLTTHSKKGKRFSLIRTQIVYVGFKESSALFKVWCYIRY